ncbi:MAG: glycosyltransferase family 2 protein [candidate division Zixibacteria bacterium]
MNSDHSSDVLVLIPAYNAAQYLPELIKRTRLAVCDENILFVNDGSVDETLDVLKSEDVKYINLPENQGKGSALMAGFAYAIEHKYRSVLTMDADLQHLPEEIYRFFAADNGQTIVIGTRKMALGVMPFPRWLTNNLTSLIISVFSSRRVRDSQSGFRLMPVEFLKAIRLRTIGYDLESEMLFKAGAMGYQVGEVPISTIYEGSHSYINPLADTLRFVRQIWRRIWA